MADVITEPEVDWSKLDEDDNIVHYACPLAMGDQVVTAYCGFSQEFPYSVWPNSPPEAGCVMCVTEHEQNPDKCPKFGTCGGRCLA